MYTKKFSEKYNKEELVEKRLILLPIFEEILNKRSWNNLIDLGCGSGYYTRKFANRDKKIVGVDGNKNQLEIARRIEEKTKLGIDYVESDLTNLKTIESNTFDVAFLIFVIVEITDKEIVKQIFNEAYRVLKKGGILIIGQVHPHNINRKSIIVEKTMLDKDDSYFDNGAPAISKTLLKNGKYISFEKDYHYTLEFILNSLRDSGFNLNMIRETSLKERHPTHIVIVEEK